MTLILLVITTLIGNQIGHYYVPEHEVLLTIVGFVIGLIIRFGDSYSIADCISTFSDFSSGGDD